MSLRGLHNSESTTMTSTGPPPQTTGLEGLFVVITVPSENPYTRRIALLRMDWQDALGNAVAVQDFGINDLVGTIGGTLFNFGGLPGGSAYTVNVRLERGTPSYTLTVRRHAATLVSNPSVVGPSQDTHATFLIDPETPIVKIGAPTQRPITQRPVPLTFDWVYSDGEKAPVQNFTLSDISTDVGTLGNFQQATGDTSRYSADLTIPQNATQTKVTVTVAKDSAEVANTTPTVLGPEEDTDKTFAIAAPPGIAGITGADSVCVLEKDIIANDLLNDVLPYLGSNAGGAWTGVLECVGIGSYLYIVVQVRKFTQTVDDDGTLVTPANPANLLSNAQAGAALIRCNTSDCSFEVLKAYSDVTLAARSLTVDSTTLYFMEGSHYMYQAGDHFSDPAWREKVGYLYKIAHPSKTIQTIGRNWRSASPTDNPDTETTDYFYGVHGGTASPILMTDGVLNMVTGYGDFEGIDKPIGAAPAKRIGNWAWIQYDAQLNQRLAELRTNGRTAFDVLKAIAIATHSTLGFENDTFFMRPRDPQKAVNANGSGITATQRTITAKDLNWGQFPTEGWFAIGDELIQHSGANNSSQFTSVVRGTEGTTPAAHTGSFEIMFIDHVLTLDADTLEMPIKSVQIENSARQLYNQVKIRHGVQAEVSVEDATSIAENGARLLEVDVPLDEHQRVWAEWLAGEYLARFKDVQQVINLTLKPSFYMAVGDVVYLKIPERVHLDGTLCQVLEVRHSFKKPPTTAVKLVTL